MAPIIASRVFPKIELPSNLSPLPILIKSESLSFSATKLRFCLLTIVALKRVSLPSLSSGYEWISFSDT